MPAMRGLTSEQAEQRLVEFGPNKIFKEAGISFFKIFRHEITEPMIVLLLVVGLFYTVWGSIEDSLTIFIIISLLVLAEVGNEYRAKKAIKSLEKIAAIKTKVLRDGRIVEVDSESVVPGDVLILAQGTKISADAKITESLGIQVDESSLSGESAPVEKSAGSKIFAGTVVVSGSGQATVFSTGSSTKFGKIASALKEVRAPKTALQLAMKKLSSQLVFVAVAVCAAITLIGILRGNDVRIMFLTGLSLSFATIPEELPIIITMILGLGSYTLSKHNFLVKKIKAAETLGNATVIVTDKTGTITEGRMQAVGVFPQTSERQIIENAALVLSDYDTTNLDKELREKASALGIRLDAGKIVGRREFGARKSKAVIRKIKGEFFLYSSGAPEDVFSRCKNAGADAVRALERETRNGRRAIATAFKKLSTKQAGQKIDGLEKQMSLIGLVFFEDAPRAGVKQTIRQVREAGIRTIMVTGDHPNTALFIAKQVGITKDDRVVTGSELDRMSDSRLREVVKKNAVFARTTPQHKHRIVRALQENKEVVAVTGDGINDALALKGADIGIAMGMKGTDVAKEAAEVVLADDNYATIANGVFEGRKLFDNLMKGVKYYLSVKTALVLLFLIPVLAGIPMPFSPIQIILLELFMDLGASAGFVSEPKEKDVYERKPRDPKKPIFDKDFVRKILLKGAFLFAAVMVVYAWAFQNSPSLAVLQSYAFAAWIASHVFLAFVSRSEKQSLLSTGVLSNKIIDAWAVAAFAVLLAGIYLPGLNAQLGLAPVPMEHLFFIVVGLGALFCAFEAAKTLLVSSRVFKPSGTRS